MAHIVSAYDGSEVSKKAVDRAVAMLGEGDILILVSILPEVKIAEMAGLDTGSGIGDLREQANAELAELRKKGVNAVAVIKEGDVVAEILKVSEETQCSVLVLGGGGISKIGKFALGSVTEAISKKARRPVLIVK